MPTQSGYDEIERLVKKFKALSKRDRDAYNEDNTRKDYVLPLFRALEWNTSDMRQVSAEDKISRGFVDFSFRINGIRKFLLETKRIGEDLNKPLWLQQAIDYAYHKGVTWAVLSDFEGLRILNAEAREANPFQAQFREFSVDEYLPRLEELWWLSRSAMLEGAMDREAERLFKKMRRAPIAEALFDNLLEWRKRLYKMLREYNKDRLWTPKIIAPTIVNRASFAFDTHGFYSNDKTSIIVTDDLFLLGVLNSQVTNFVMRNISSTKQGGYFEQKPMYIEQLPIRRIDF